MKRSLSKMYLTALSCLAATALLAGCGDDEPKVTCGEGTQKVGNTCTLESEPVSCADGTTLTGDECVPNVACGAGTSADATGECVPDYDQLECADGTKLDGTTCVPDTDALCEAGTHVDSGSCVADVICGSGTTARDGECLSNDDLLALDADVTEEDVENDLDFGGTPQTVTLPAASETLTIAGTLGAPVDKDNDGVTDQDFDTYQIAGEAGDYLRLEAIDNGSGTVGFLVQGPNDYVRLSPVHASAGERKVLLPYDGDYTVTVGPTSHFLNGSLGAHGGDDAGYVLAIENLGDIDTSTATAVDATAGESTSGNFADLGDNLVAINATAGSTLKVSFPELGVDVNPTAILLNANGDVIGEQQIDAQGLVRVPASDDDLQVLLDYVVLQGERDAYTLDASVRTAESVTDTLRGTVKTTEDESSWVIPAGDSVHFAFDVALEDDAGTAVAAGLVQTVVATSDLDVLEYRVYDPNNERVRGFNALSGFHATVGGTHVLEIINTDPLRTVEVTAVDFASYVPADLGSFDATTSTNGDHSFATAPAGDFRFVTFETTEAVSATLASVQNSSQRLGLYLLTDNMSIFASDGGQTPGLANLPLMNPGRYFGLIFNLGSDDATSVNTTLETSEGPVQSSEPNNALADATQITTVDTYTYGTLTGGPMRDVDIFEIATGITEPTLVETGVYRMSDAGVIGVELRDENGVLYDITNDSSTAYVGAVLQPGVTYYLHVYRTSGFGALPYLVEVMHNDTIDADLEVEGNDTEADASAMATLLNPLTFAGGGTLVGSNDVDWYTFNLSSSNFMSIQMGTLGKLLESTDVELELYEDDGSGNITQTPLSDLMALAAGTKYLKVSGGTSNGYANSYSLRATVISPTDIGEPSADALSSQTGTFGSDGLKLLRFDLASDLPSDDSQSLVVWSDAALTILDDAMQPIHTASSNGDGPEGAGFLSTSLTAGTYYVRLDGSNGDDWQLITGTLASTMESEPNDTDAEANDLGTLASGSALHTFGSVNDSTDTLDYFTFTVPDLAGDESPQSVTVEHLQLGEDIADIDIAVLDDTGAGLGSFGWGWVTPQFETFDLVPGVYTIVVSHYGHTEPGDYLVHTYLQ